MHQSARNSLLVFGSFSPIDASIVGNHRVQVLSRRDANAGTRRCDEAARPVRGEGSTSATTPMLRGPSTADLTALTNAVTRAIHFNGGEENSEKSKLLIFPDKARYVPSCSTSAITRTSALVTTTASTSLRPRTLSLSEINGAAALCAVERLRSEVASVASAAESQRFRFLSVIANRDAEIDSLKSTRDAALFLVNQRNIEIQVLQSTRDSDFTRVARRDEQLLQRDAVILLRNAVILSLESARDSAVSALSAALSAKDAALLRCADVEATAAASASATASTLALASASTLALASATATATATVASSLSRAHAAEAALEEAVYALQACEATLAALAICGAAAAKNLLREGVEDCREHAAVPEGVEDCREHAAVPVRIAQKHASSAVSLAATLAEVLATLRVATRTNTLAQGGGEGGPSRQTARSAALSPLLYRMPAIVHSGAGEPEGERMGGGVLKAVRATASASACVCVCACAPASASASIPCSIVRVTTSVPVARLVTFAPPPPVFLAPSLPAPAAAPAACPRSISHPRRPSATAGSSASGINGGEGRNATTSTRTATAMATATSLLLPQVQQVRSSSSSRGRGTKNSRHNRHSNNGLNNTNNTVVVPAHRSTSIPRTSPLKFPPVSAAPAVAAAYRECDQGKNRLMPTTVYKEKVEDEISAASPPPPRASLTDLGSSFFFSLSPTLEPQIAPPAPKSLLSTMMTQSLHLVEDAEWRDLI